VPQTSRMTSFGGCTANIPDDWFWRVYRKHPGRLVWEGVPQTSRMASESVPQTLRGLGGRARNIARESLAESSKPPPKRVSRLSKNRGRRRFQGGTWQHPEDCVESKQTTDRLQPSDRTSMYLLYFGLYGHFSLIPGNMRDRAVCQGYPVP